MNQHCVIRVINNALHLELMQLCLNWSKEIDSQAHRVGTTAWGAWPDDQLSLKWTMIELPVVTAVIPAAFAWLMMVILLQAVLGLKLFVVAVR